MAYTTDDTLSQDPIFKGRIRMSTVKAAVAVVNEAPTSRSSVDKKRHSLAVAILNLPAFSNDSFTQASIEAGGLVSSSTDAQLDTAIASVWNGIAGVASGDP